MNNDLHAGSDNAKSAYGVTIGFSTTRKFLSWVIRKVTGASCSHAFLAFDDYALNMRMVMQAEAWGLELRPWQKWYKENILLAVFKPAGSPPHPVDSALLESSKNVGNKYDFLNAILIGIVTCRLFKRFRSLRKLCMRRGSSEVSCAEAVVLFLKKAGYACVEGLDADITSPGELFECVSNSSGDFQLCYLLDKYLEPDRKGKLIPESLKDPGAGFDRRRDPACVL